MSNRDRDFFDFVEDVKPREDSGGGVMAGLAMLLAAGVLIVAGQLKTGHVPSHISHTQVIREGRHVLGCK